jgi:hypothetical protein
MASKIAIRGVLRRCRKGALQGSFFLSTRFDYLILQQLLITATHTALLAELRGGPGDGPVPLDHLRPLHHVHRQGLGAQFGVLLEHHLLRCVEQGLVAPSGTCHSATVRQSA